MSNLILRVGFHAKAAVKKLFFKTIYGKQVFFGKNVCFRRNFFLFIEKGGKVSIGDGCYFNNDVSINCLESISIGKNCLIAENVKLYDHNHRFRDFSKPMSEQGFTHKPITIGDDCWLCANVTVLQGVTIGNHCVIGANCLIYKDVPDNTIVRNETKQVMYPIENKGE